MKNGYIIRSGISGPSKLISRLSVIYCLFLFYIVEFITMCESNQVDPRIDGSSPMKIGLSPMILKVFIKGNPLANDVEKVLELYAKEYKTQNDAYSGRSPMMDYLEKVYSMKNYDLLRPYRSIFRGLKTLGKHDHTTQASWIKFLRRGKYPSDEYWELNEPDTERSSLSSRMPYHRFREKLRIEKLNKEVQRTTALATTVFNTTSNTTNSTQSPSHRKHPHLKLPFDLLGRKQLSTPPTLRFCDKPCIANEENGTKLASTSRPEKEEPTQSSEEDCDEDDQEVEVVDDSTDELSIPFNTKNCEVALKAATHAQSTAHPSHITTTKNTKLPKVHVSTGTSNPLIWTLAPHPILDKNDENHNVVSTRLQGRNGSPESLNTSASYVRECTPSCNCYTPYCTCCTPTCVFCTPSSVCSATTCSPTHSPCNARRPQKIIVRISSSLAEVPVVIMRDSRTSGVSLSLVNDFILDDKNKLVKKSGPKNKLMASRSKYKFNQSTALPMTQISRKILRNLHHPVDPSTVRPQSVIQNSLFAIPPRPYHFQVQPLNPIQRYYGFPETRMEPPEYPVPYSLGLRPPVLPLYFSNGGLQVPIPPPRPRFGMNIE